MELVKQKINNFVKRAKFDVTGGIALLKPANFRKPNPQL
jgi:hypothetical protein